MSSTARQLKSNALSLIKSKLSAPYFTSLMSTQLKASLAEEIIPKSINYQVHLGGKLGTKESYAIKSIEKQKIIESINSTVRLLQAFFVERN